MHKQMKQRDAAMTDLKDELEQERREKEWAETWKPSEPGDALIGRLEGYDEATTDFGEYTVAHIRDESGVLKGLWLMHSVLQDEWEEAAPEEGDRVGAMYHGKRAGDTYDYHVWSVKVDRTAGGGKTDRKPQGRQRESGGDFDGDELFAPPDSGEETAGERPTLDDPNSELPY